MLNIYPNVRNFDDSLIEDVNTVFDTAFKVLGYSKKGIKFNLYVVSNNAIHELNLSERGVDRATDVLSFPYTNLHVGEKLNIDDYKYDIDSADNTLLLGEIFICNTIAKRQAVKYGHSYKREFCFLFLHGLLHCLGYDHIEESDRIVMEEAQNKILNKCKITRD